jgi:hypothetical protein
MRLRRTFVGVKAFVGVKVRVRTVVIVLIAALPSGCAAGGYNAGSLHRRLVHAGLQPAQATCVIDKMVKRFGDAQLNVRTAPIEAEIRAERTLLRACGVVTKPPS